jgi:uncharacterized protein YozE (UPF0346 family)
MTEADKSLYTRIGLTIGAVVGAYFLVIKPILQKFNIQKSDAEIETDKLVKTGTQKFITDATTKPNPKQANAGKLSRPEGQYAVWADQIYNDLNFSALDRKTEDAFNILNTYIHNDADIATLIKYFGTRQDHAFGLPVGNPKNLSQFVVSNMKANQIKTLDESYTKSKMTFRF